MKEMYCYEEIQGATSERHSQTEDDLGQYIRLMVEAFGDYCGILISNPIGRVIYRSQIPTN